MSQKQQILQHMKQGKAISPLYALHAFECFRLAARVEELRRDGWPVVTRIKKTPSGKHIAEYKL